MLQNYDLIAIVGLKGGVGKTNTAWHILPAVLKNQETEFKIFEIDDNNNSNFFSNSSIIPGRCQTVLTNDKNIVAQIVVETIAGENKILIDGGGGNDSRRAIDLIKSVGDDVRKLWLIPFDRNEDNFDGGEDAEELAGALETFELIGDPKNTFFVLNGHTKDKSEFDWFYSKNIENYIEVPWSDLFQFSQKQKYTIYDLALISQTVPKTEIKKLLSNKFTKDGVLDSGKFIEAFNEYLKSEKAGDLLNDVFVNFAQKKSQNRKKN